MSCLLGGLRDSTPGGTPWRCSSVGLRQNRVRAVRFLNDLPEALAPAPVPTSAVAFRGPYGAMAEQCAHVLNRNAMDQQGHRERVPQAVRAESRDASPIAARGRLLAEADGLSGRERPFSVCSLARHAVSPVLPISAAMNPSSLGAPAPQWLVHAASQRCNSVEPTTARAPPASEHHRCPRT